MAASQTHQALLADYGPRLSQEQYERRILALGDERPATPSATDEINLRAAEMSLLIDYHLGTKFPEHRRKLILQEHRRLSHRFLWRLVCSVAMHPLRPSDGLARTQVRSFSKLLDDSELAALFDLTLNEVGRLKG